MKFNYRLKIIEQILIVMIFAVLTPMVVSGVIINNINQHSVRRELNYSVSMISEVVVKNIETFFYAAKSELNTIALAIKYLPRNSYRRQFLEALRKNSSEISDIKIEDISVYNEKFKNNKDYYYDKEARQVFLAQPLDSKNCLVATIDRKVFEKKLFEIFKNDERQVYLLDGERKLVLSNNLSDKEYKYAMESLPAHLVSNKPKTFGKVKNQPLAYYKVKNPDLIVIVNTTNKVTQDTINIARYKIILAIVLSVLFIFSVVGIYTSYLYINIKQLFKGILAISKGNYKRKIRLLTNVFTPFELIFLANEFNGMVSEINLSYRRLTLKNKELKKLDGFRSNLIDTVSHELRTPLTSIKGYTSRLLRQDIQIDKETEIKSLKVIRRQAERLSRMVEDLLVIPDIEGARLNIKIDTVNLEEVAQISLNSLKDVENSNIDIDIPQNFPLIYADKDRLEQILINLLENAKKYAYEDSKITLAAYAKEGDDIAYIKVENSADYIKKEDLDTLFDKFTRIDDQTTRTTRGTGLGLFIVKGLIEAMGGKIRLNSSPDNRFTVSLTLPVAND